MLIVALLMTGFGSGFAEALLNPLIIDIHHEQSGKFLNIGHAFFPAGIMVWAPAFWRITDARLRLALPVSNRCPGQSDRGHSFHLTSASHPAKKTTVHTRNYSPAFFL